MNLIPVDVLGMWQFCFYAMQDWAVMEGYKWPDEAYIKANVKSYYIFNFDSETTTGRHKYVDGVHHIFVKVGLKNELITWAHEFAHLIQCYNLGDTFLPQYAEQQSTVGYSSNRFECQARRAGAFAQDLYKRKILRWYSDIYNMKKGEHSVWPKPKPKPKLRPKEAARLEGMWSGTYVYRPSKHELYLERLAWKTTQRRHHNKATNVNKTKGGCHGKVRRM